MWERKRIIFIRDSTGSRITIEFSIPAGLTVGQVVRVIEETWGDLLDCGWRVKRIRIVKIRGRNE